MVQLVKSFSAPITGSLPPMPIAIDNGLPHITFQLGADVDTASLAGLMDTCGALNTGFLPFHQWLMSERPDLVAEFVSFDDANPFEIVKLGGAILDPANFDAEHHGNLTAVIRYYTPYSDTNGNPVTISFALGNDVSVNTIFGLPLLHDLDPVIDLGTNSLVSRTLKETFPITRSAVTHGLPTGCTFDPATAALSAASTYSSSNQTTTITPEPQPVLATATDDHSKGYLQRRVHPIPT